MMKRPSAKDRAMLVSVNPRNETETDIAHAGTGPSHVGPLERAPVTAPGSMMAAVYANKAVKQEKEQLAHDNELLKEELQVWAGSTLTKKIPTSLVVQSKWANRHSDNFVGAKFLEFVKEIESAGGNIQPIKVRPVAGSDPQIYEIIYGHRRHKACAELGLDVLASIESITDQSLFEQMDRENRQRADLRPYEQGLMYARALDEGLYKSARKMAESLGVDRSNVGKALDLARLPKDVLGAFDTPLEIQYGWATKLNAALQKDPDMVLARAKDIQKQVPRPKSKEVLARLLGGWGIVPHPPEKPISLKGSKGQAGSIVQDPAAKSMVVTLKNVDPAKLDALRKLIQEFID